MTNSTVNNSSRTRSRLIPNLARRRNLLLVCLISCLSILAFFFYYTSTSADQPLSIHSSFNWFNRPVSQDQLSQGQNQGEAKAMEQQGQTHSSESHTLSKMESLSSFLQGSKQRAIQHLSRERPLENGLVIIMGNEAGDLDSLASAISLSYFLSQLPLDLVLSESSPTFDFSKPSYVPLLQLKREDLSLRQENVALLSSLEISTSDVLFMDDLESSPLSLDLKTSEVFSPKSNTFLGLVDHPSLSTRFGGPSRDTDQFRGSNEERKVVIVMDHHQDEGSHSKASLRIIKGPNEKDKTSGSAISLIINLFNHQLSENIGLPRELVYLGLGAICIDTDNLKMSPLGKAKPLDLESHQVLLNLSNFSANNSSTSFSSSIQKLNPLSSSSTSSIGPIRSLRNSLSKFQSSSILNLPSQNLENSPPPSDNESNDTKPPQSKATHEFWKLLSGLKAQVNHLNTRDLLKRDLKTEIFFLPQEFASQNTSTVGKDGSELTLKLSYSSVPLGLSEWLHRNERKGSDLNDSYKIDWEVWWDQVESWMKEENINLAIILNSFREKKTGSERGKHRRELVAVYLPPSRSIIPTNISNKLFQSFLGSLLSDSHADPADLTSRLLLEYPWKGGRITENDKKEKVSGIEDGLGGKRIRLKETGSKEGNENEEMMAMVFKQTNQKANRKIVVPAVNFALREAVEKIKGSN